MTKQHDIGHYLDGRVSVAFCKVCSAEGEKLLEDCPQFQLKPSSVSRYKMARYLDLSPTDKSSWPMSEIDRLIHVEETEGSKRLFEEIRKLMANKP